MYSTKSPPRRATGPALFRACTLVAISIALFSCNLDTTSPSSVPPFPPAWRLKQIDGRDLPDTLDIYIANTAPSKPHRVNDGAAEFFLVQGFRTLRWTFQMIRLEDATPVTQSFDGQYYQFGADSLVFPITRSSIPSEFFGGKHNDTLTITTFWSGDFTTAAALVGGSHTFRFVRDTSIK